MKDKIVYALTFFELIFMICDNAFGFFCRLKVSHADKKLSK
jgi:hypothetical protein